MAFNDGRRDVCVCRSVWGDALIALHTGPPRTKVIRGCAQYESQAASVAGVSNVKTKTGPPANAGGLTNGNQRWRHEMFQDMRLGLECY